MQNIPLGFVRSASCYQTAMIHIYTLSPAIIQNSHLGEKPPLAELKRPEKKHENLNEIMGPLPLPTVSVMTRFQILFARV